MRQFLVSFHIELMAGCTVDVPHHGGEVDRPTGMDGWILNLTTAGAIGGGFWGSLVGLLFLNPILGAAVGAMKFLL